MWMRFLDRQRKQQRKNTIKSDRSVLNDFSVYAVILFNLLFLLGEKTLQSEQALN